jgi:hypothetical protein
MPIAKRDGLKLYGNLSLYSILAKCQNGIYRRYALQALDSRPLVVEPLDQDLLRNYLSSQFTSFGEPLVVVYHRWSAMIFSARSGKLLWLEALDALQ